jgi:hypothetical protein
VWFSHSTKGRILRVSNSLGCCRELWEHFWEDRERHFSSPRLERRRKLRRRSVGDAISTVGDGTATVGDAIFTVGDATSDVAEQERRMGKIKGWSEIVGNSGNKYGNFGKTWKWVLYNRTKTTV